MWKLRVKFETEDKVQGFGLVLIGPGEGGSCGDAYRRTLLAVTLIKWRFMLYVIKT